MRDSGRSIEAVADMKFVTPQHTFHIHRAECRSATATWTVRASAQVCPLWNCAGVASADQLDPRTASAVGKRPTAG
ncbi:hypothetical protein ACWKSP_41350, partial [Micromonosporaceae bacterium Da 78-11]